MFWLPSLLIGTLLLIKSNGQSDNKFAGVLILKSLMLIGLWTLLDQLEEYNQIYDYLTFIPDVLLSIFVVAFYRALLKDEVLFIFYLGDLIRWVSILIEFLVPDPYPEPFFYLQFYISFFFVAIFPSLYAVYGFMEIRSIHTIKTGYGSPAG